MPGIKRCKVVKVAGKGGGARVFPAGCSVPEGRRNRPRTVDGKARCKAYTRPDGKGVRIGPKGCTVRTRQEHKKVTRKAKRTELFYNKPKSKNQLRENEQNTRKSGKQTRKDMKAGKIVDGIESWRKRVKPRYQREPGDDQGMLVSRAELKQAVQNRIEHWETKSVPMVRRANHLMKALRSGKEMPRGDSYSLMDAAVRYAVVQRNKKKQEPKKRLKKRA